MNITNEKVTKYICSFYKAQNSKLMSLRELSEENRIPIILKETESFLKVLLHILEPVKILEIGTATGYSACFFAEVTAPNCQIVSIEHNSERYAEAAKNIGKLGMENRISLYQGDACEIMEQLKDRGEKDFDFVFIDAAKSHYKRFWEGAISICSPDVTIVSDNVLMKAMTASDEYDENRKHKTNIRKMREYVEYIQSLDYCTTSVIAVGDGLAVSKLNM